MTPSQTSNHPPAFCILAVVALLVALAMPTASVFLSRLETMSLSQTDVDLRLSSWPGLGRIHTERERRQGKSRGTDRSDRTDKFAAQDVDVVHSWMFRWLLRACGDAGLVYLPPAIIASVSGLGLRPPASGPVQVGRHLDRRFSLLAMNQEKQTAS